MTKELDSMGKSIWRLGFQPRNGNLALQDLRLCMEAIQRRMEGMMAKQHIVQLYSPKRSPYQSRDHLDSFSNEHSEYNYVQFTLTDAPTLRRIRSSNSPPGIESDASTSLRMRNLNGIMEELRLDGPTLRGLGQTTRSIAIGSSQRFMQAILHI